VSHADIEVGIQIDALFAGYVDPDRLKRSAAATLRHQGVRGPAELSIVITGDGTLRRLNRTFRGIDAVTDVLSFWNAEKDDFMVGSEALCYLGDVIISFPQAKAQARDAGHPVEAELQLLAVHGLLHLLGHDHADPDEKAAMWSAQANILSELGVPVVDFTPASAEQDNSMGRSAA
jgi:probable rRNA maturation factor